MKPKVLFAFVVTFCICWFQFVTDFQPKVLCMVYCLQKGILGPSNMQNLAFTRVKVHFPCLLPLFKFLKVLLQCLRIIFAGGGQIYGSVISKKSDLRIYVSGRAFMCRRNKIGPSTKPWGTPEVTGISDDFPLLKPHIVNVRARML